MLGRRPASFLDLQFSPGVNQFVSANITDLQTLLEEIRVIWASKTAELKFIENDHDIDRDVELNISDRCCRICYVNGVRIILNESVIVLSKVGSSSYRIQLPDGTVELAHGYQLFAVAENPDRAGFSRPAPTVSPPVDPDLLAIKRELRLTPRGVLIASVYRGLIYVGELEDFYVRGEVCSVLFYQPIDGRFLRYTTSSDLEKALEVVQVKDIIKVGVVLGEDGFCDPAQFSS